MHIILLYLSLFLASLALILCLITLARLGKFIESVHGLDWSAVAGLTGELGVMKKSIQTLNNRFNGMQSPIIEQKNLMAEYMQQVQQNKTNGKMQGG